MSEFSILRLDSSANTISAQIRIEPSHPCLRGHFDGFPLLPAVSQLDLVRQLVEQPPARQSSVVAGKNIKFLELIQPEDIIDITIEKTDSGAYRFVFQKNGSLTTKGEIKLQLTRDEI